MIKNYLIMILGIVLGVFISNKTAIDLQYSIYVYMFIIASFRILLYIIKNENKANFSIVYTLVLILVSGVLSFVVTFLSMYFGMPFYIVFVVGYGYYIFKDLHSIIIYNFFKKNV